MNILVAAANAPRQVVIADRVYRVKSATLRDLAELVAFVEDRVKAPKGKLCAPFSGKAAQDLLLGPQGLPLIVFLALRSCQPEVTYEQAKDIALAGDATEVLRVVEEFFRRRPSAPAQDTGDRCDLTEIPWGRQFFMIVEEAKLTFDEILDLTLDQYEILGSRGKADDSWVGRDLDVAEAQRIWERAQTSEAQEPPAEPVALVAEVPPVVDSGYTDEVAKAIERLNAQDDTRQEGEGNAGPH